MVIVAGFLTPAKELAVCRAHRVRGERLTCLYNFFLESNPLYLERSVSRRDEGLVDQQPVLERDGSAVPDYSCGSTMMSSGCVKGPSHVVVADLDSFVAAEQCNVRERLDAAEATTSAEEAFVREAAGVYLASDGTLCVERLSAGARMNFRAPSSIDDPVVVRQGGALVPDQTTNLYALMFWVLFPYGRGDPDDVQPMRVSRAQCVRHYLRLSSQRFAQDSVFPLVAFDMFSRQLALSHASLYCRLRSEEQDACDAGVTPRELGALLEYDAACLSAACSSMPRPPLPAEVGQTKVLTNRVRAAAAHAKGSDASRQVQLRRGFALQLRYGNPHVFTTISPKDNGSLAVAYLAGQLACDKLVNIDAESMHTHAKQFVATAKDPAAVAPYSDRVVRTFLDEIFGFDVKEGRPLARGGVFGYTKAYIAGVETQSDGTLHLHALVWLHGTPAGMSELQSLLKDDKYRQGFVRFADSVQQHSVPLPVSACPSCPASTGSIEAVEFHKETCMRGSGGSAPTTSRFTLCCSGFGHGDLIEAAP